MYRILRRSSAWCVLLFIFLLAPLAADARASTVASPASSSVLGPPTVSATYINLILAQYHSPAAGKGQALFNDGVQYGIDPVYALAFFMHESSFGTAGIARETLSLGNLRCIPDTACYQGFAAFPSWEAGFVAWYQLIRDVYVDSWGLTTVEQIIPRYAPPSDNNDDSAYINAVESAVAGWRSGQIALLGPMPQGGQTAGTTPTAPVTSYPPDSYKLQGKPSVTVAFINKVLQQYHSPAANEGQAIYDAGLKYGIDPVYALAFFLHDSIFGTVGLARVSHAMGTIRAPASAGCQCTVSRGYRWYANWRDGLIDWFRYMHDHYVQAGLTTVSQVVPNYSQVKDQHAITSFIQAIEHRVDVWRAEQMAPGTQTNTQSAQPQPTQPVQGTPLP